MTAEIQPASMNKQQKENQSVNNFVITFSTVNGSGSITANSIILRSFYRMGIPSSGKNYFPSNIQGMPTWYTVRLNKNGFLGRSEMDDIVVAMNASTIDYEIKFLHPNGVLFYDDRIALPSDIRDDIYVYPMPVKKIVKEADVSSHLRNYVANVVYIGILSYMIEIPLEILRDVLGIQFKKSQKANDINMDIIERAALWASENLNKRDSYRVQVMDDCSDKLIIDGNSAAALGAIYGGVQFFGWYPITPATGIHDALQELLPELRKDPITGKNTYVVVQAEDEISAVGMAVGAGWGGLRSMTATSGPGLSLMTEYIGMAYFAEVPLVIWDVQRAGPSTGMPTRTSQGDVTFSYFMSHGDTRHIILIPGTMTECFDFGWKAFDIAERYQTPVIVLSDLDLGMNQWVTERFTYPDTPMDRGKVLWEQGLEKILKRSEGEWGRYLDIDGDGIPYRTIPGNRHPKAAYFSRGTGHDEFGGYSEDAEVWERILARIEKKFDTARENLPKPIVFQSKKASIGLITIGSTHLAVEEARHIMQETGIESSYMRIRSLPLCEEVRAFIEAHDRCYIVEINRDGQLRQLLILEYPEYASQLIKMSHMDGMPLTAAWIINGVLSHEEIQ
jgi:2-oxoglutarate/2-oxoacid ferredoxin oxidoreductase subunit alpha